MSEKRFTAEEMVAAIMATARAERQRSARVEAQLERLRPELEHQARSAERIATITGLAPTAGGDPQ